MRKGGPNPWAVDYNENVAAAQSQAKQDETLIDKAKSFSF